MLILRQSLLLLSGLVLSHGGLWAQVALRDPTTPPPGFKLPVSAGSGSATQDPAAQAPQAIVRITPVGGRKQAVMDGRTLQAGEQIQQWRLVSITANGVVLKDSRGARSVSTLPSSVSKKPVSGAASEK
jgi:hypothetical protein